MKIRKIFFFIFLIGFYNLSAQRIDDSLDVESLRKKTTSEDDAFGVLDKGELINIIGNQGIISDSYYQNLIYNFRWPKSKGMASLRDVNITDDVNVLFAHKGNVLDSYTRYRAEDWQAPPGALGKYHADDQPAELLAPDGAPRLAHSDIPITWPKGFVDEDGNWNPAPTGDFVSLSDANKELVLSKGAFYDEDKNVWRFWPGNFRMDIDPDSPTYGKQVLGEFAADREVYAISTDHNAQPPSTPLGLKLEMQGYSYGSRIAQDFQFYDITITNTSDQVLDSCWFGYYVDFQFGDVLEETYGSYNTNINPNGYDNAFYQFDYNGSSPGNPEIGYVGAAILGSPFDLGVTDAHFFRDLTGSITPASDENIWPVMISDPTSPNLMSDASNYFHGSNTHFDDFSLTAEGNSPGPTNWTLFATTGPFTLNPGEKMHSTFVFAAGNDLKDLQKNLSIAQDLYLNHFIGPQAPPSPILKASAGDQRVTLYWDNISEKIADPVTKRKDFEGYKIYRSQDQGATWGKEIKDSKGSLVGYVPIAQFDIDNIIQGVDPINQFNYLGDNTGIVHMFVDSTVLNGVNYSYTITAYDSGSVKSELESLESAKGTTAADANLVDVTPRSNAIGYVPGNSEITHSAGVGNGIIETKVAVPEILTGDDYLIAFNQTPADSFYFINESSGEKLTTVKMASDEMQVINGLRLRIEGDSQTGGIKTATDKYGNGVYGSDSLSMDGGWFVDLTGTNELADRIAKGSNYQIRFSADGSFAAGLTAHNKSMIKKYTVPFEIWNTTLPGAEYKVNSILLDANHNDEYDLGDEIRIVNNSYNLRGDTVGTFSLLDWYYSITIDTVAGIGGRIPETNEMITLDTYSELSTLDTFRVKIEAPGFLGSPDVVRQRLSEIKVVPNPFIVDASWEQLENNRRLRFMYLPPECSIKIYTVRGELVKRINHENGTGDEDWNLTNESGVEVAFGLYIYVVEIPGGGKSMGKFAIIK